MNVDTLENNLKEFLSNPESTNHLTKARDLAEEILNKKKDSSYANYVLALDDIEFCNYDDAIEKLEKILENDNSFEEAYLQLSMIYEHEKMKEKRFLMLEKGYQHCPECYMIAFDYACMLMNDYADVYKAKDILSDCVHKLPQMPNNWAQLGIAYIATQEPEMAKECFITCLHLDKENVLAHLGLGVYFFETSQFKKAKEFYKKTLEKEENFFANFNLSLLELLQGNYKKGFELYEKHRDKEKFLEKYGGDGYPELTKKNLKEKNLKIVVHREQGYGDDFMASRFLKSFLDKNYEVSFAAHKSTINFFKSCPELDSVNISDKFDDVDETSFDYRIFMMSLPYLFWENSKKIINPLIVDVERLKSFNVNFNKFLSKRIDKSKLNIGVSWSGNPQHKRHLNRSIQIDIFSEIFKNNDCKFFVLQKGVSNEEHKFLQKFSNVEVLDNKLEDFSQTALALGLMDRVITVDTSLVHLAGTLDQKTLLLLPKVPDWRWGLKDSKTPWYKSVKMVRQSKFNDWSHINNEVKKFLS
tara:strand:+ start:449 stop:2032 length:1584 start_codon:yes stop_codon:yes gene_type:complete